MDSNELEQVKDFIQRMEERYEARLDDLEERFNSRLSELATGVDFRFDKLELEVKKLSEANIASMKASISLLEWAQSQREEIVALTARITELERRLSKPPEAA